MEKSSVSENENILVKVDQNNLIYIDPNSVIDKNGYISSRGIKQENLVIYVNLEADIIPRSILVADNDKNTYTSIAKGTFNFLKNQSTPDFDTNWTNAFLETKKKIFKDEETGQLIPGEIQYDQTGQSFGMNSIEIDTKGFNAIPDVTITFTDVRGKTLFESPENSPYKAFFHVPWPIFYLTIKGFYGKAIRYRLHLVKFTSRFDESSGNFEVTTKFIGSTFAYLNDIPLKGMLNAPYMFLIESTKDAKTDGTTTTKVVSRSSKGYTTLKSVYAEYIDKGLLPPNFPTKTLRELLTTAQSLDKLWESQILSERLDGRIFVGLDDYEKTLTSLEKRILAWGNVVLSKNYTVVNPGANEILYYALAGNKKDDPTRIIGNTSVIQNTLEAIIESGKKELDGSKLFTDNILKDKSMDIDFTRKTLLSKTLGDINRYVRKINGQYEVAFDLLTSDFNEIKNLYQSQKDKLEEAVEKKMNDILKDNTKGGFGFEPTLRNIFGVILANADAYVRLLKDVHQRSFEVSISRKKLIAGLSEETKDDDSIYPWPEIKKYDGNKQKVLAYPGERDLVTKLKSDNPILWPEVDFIEDYIGISTNRVDTNTDKESGVGNINYVFESDDIDKTKMLTISSLLSVSNATPYLNPSPSSFLYEIWERANQITLIDSFDNKILNKIAEEEFNNIKEAVKDNDELIYLLSTSATTANNLINLLPKFSPFERYPYYLDSIPTVPYLKRIYNQSYKIEKYKKSKNPVTPTGFEIVNESLLNYSPDQYRTSIYPFNSDLYLDYLNINNFSIFELKLRDTFKIDTSEGFIVSPISPTSWVKSNTENLFTNKIKLQDTSVNILNTPYFHNQLYSDLTTVGTKGKYVGSAYLLLNSLPFSDLQSNIIFDGTSLGNSGGVRMSSLFREIGSTHFVPYHLIIKWGSLYHRYKKYLIDGVDILEGFLDNSNITQPIPSNTFFNNDQTADIWTGFTVDSETITFSGQSDIGVHPYYDALYHEIINGYNHYNLLSGNTSFSGNVIDNTIRIKSRSSFNGLKYWTQFVDNSKFDPTNLQYTLLPCDGANENIDQSPFLIIDTFPDAYQAYFRIIWVDNDNILNEFSGKTFASYGEYNLSYVSGETTNGDNIYSIDTNYRKIIDLIGTFSPYILDEFEQMFIDFATEKINDASIYNKFNEIKYSNFQDLLKEIVTVEKTPSDNTDLNLLINELKQKQLTKLKNITNEILSQNSLVKITIGNPKELDSYVLNGFLETQESTTFSYGEYEVSQLTTENTNFIKLYIGEDIDGYYQSFFSSMNVELNEDNILQFRPLILIYGGYLKDGNPNTIDDFKTYLRDNIILKNKSNQESAGSATRLSTYLQFLTDRFTKLKPQEIKRGQSKFNGYNDDPLKLELYNHFKSFNDKWIAGNSIGQKLLLEEFLFLDKANKDIGDDVYFNVDRLIDLANPKNEKQNLYGVISILLEKTGLDLRALPAYVNFYGTNYNNKSKIEPSSKVAENLFGTFLDVDYQESSPKIIIQLVGGTSKHLADTSSKNKFKDDSYFVGSTHNNSLIITNPDVFKSENLFKSNRVVAFEVSFGDQNQSIFKGVTLDQTSLKNTTESFVVLENLARSESGAGAYNVDIGLFDYYRQASYACEVTMMGNVMIQPTMYFYLKNIPMFRGSYLITEVRHSVKNNNVTTTFKGTRIPYASLPDPKDYFLASYRVLFDKLMNKTISRIKNEQQRTATTINIKDEEGNNYTTDIGLQLDNENIDNIIVKEVGVSKFGIPYNGFLGEKYIQLIKYKNAEWLRTRVVRLGGTNYPLNDNDEFGLISLLNGQERLKWSEIKESAKTKNFYTTKFKIISSEAIIPENIITYNTLFIVPKYNSNENLLRFTQNGTYPNRIFTGQIGMGPNLEGYGMAMSESLMKTLNIQDGDIVYFKLVQP